MHQTLLKEWGPKSLSTLAEDTIQELLVEITRFIEIFFIFISQNPDCFLHPDYSILSEANFNTNDFYFRGLNLLELAAYLEQKAAHLLQEGFRKLKVALAGMDMQSLFQILEESFGHVDPDSISSISSDTPSQKPANIEKLTEEEPPEKVLMIPMGESSLATTELVFPLRSLSPIIASIPESLLPLHGPETLSHYRCQHQSCNEKFSQKAVACNHVCHDHLNVALACLYCSANNSHKMRWYSASPWECHTC